MSPADPADTRTHEAASVGDGVTVGFEPPADSLPPSGTFAGYELGEILGRGGMGVVYRARQAGLNRTVALKMMLGGSHANPVERLRFLTEAEVIGSLAHPNVVPVFAFGTHDGQPYFAMEHLPGGTLADRMKVRPLPPVEAARLVETLARAVHAAHQKGVIHRDLKPGNVLFAGDGTPKIVDFGLARQAASDLTATQAVMGTPSYMAPEQAAGKARDVGPATDVYALGAILYATLTGQPPFDGGSPVATIERVKNDEPTPPRVRNRAIPRDLETICLKCLRKELSGRYESAEALAEDLGRFLAGEPIRARRVGVAERLVRWAIRKPAQAGLIAALVLLVVAGAGTAAMAALWKEALSQRRTSEKLLGEMTQEQKRTVEALAGEKRAVLAAGAAKENLEHVTALNRVVLAHRAWQAGDVLTALKELSAVPPPRREWEWSYVNQLCHGESKKFSFPGHVFPMSLAISPDGRLAAVGVKVNKDEDPGADAVVDHAEVRILDLETGQLKGTLPYSGLFHQLSFDPTGRWLLTNTISTPAGEDTDVVIWDWSRGVRVAEIPGAKSVYLADFDPVIPGRVYVRGLIVPFTVWQVAEGKPPEKIRAPGFPPDVEDERGALTYFKASPDGKRSMAIGLNGLLSWAPAEPGRMTRIPFDSVKFNPVQLAGLFQIKVQLTRDGKTAAIGWSDGTITLVDMVEGKLLAAIAAESAMSTQHTFGPAGRLFSVGISEHVVRVWDGTTGAPVDTLRGHTASIQGIGVRASTGEVVTASLDNTVRIWPVSGTTENRSMKQVVLGKDGKPTGNLSVPVWTPDLSTLVAWDGMPRTFRVWDTVAGREKLPGISWNDLTRSQQPITDGKEFQLSNRGDIHIRGDGTLSAIQFPGSGKPDRTARIHRYNVRASAPVGPPRELPLTDPFGSRAAFSADGKRVAIETNRTNTFDKPHEPPPPGEQSTVRVYDVETGRELFSTDRLPQRVSELKLTSDGRRLLVYFFDGSIRGWEIDTGAEAFPSITRASSPDKTVVLVGLNRPTFSPDGRYLAYWAGRLMEPTIHILDLETGSEKSWPSLHNGNITGFAFRPDNKRLLSFGTEKRVKLWDPASGTNTLMLNTQLSVNAAAFDEDGRKILVWQGGWRTNPVVTIFETDPPKK